MQTGLYYDPVLVYPDTPQLAMVYLDTPWLAVVQPRGGSTRLTFSNQVSLKGPNSSSLSLCLQTSAQQRLKEVHIALHRKSLKLISEFPNNTFQLQIDVC